MAKKGKTKHRIFTIVFMFLVSSFFVGIVSFVYLVTKEAVLRNESLFLKRSVLYTAKIVVPDSPVEVEKLFVERVDVKEDSAGEPIFYDVKKEDGQVMKVLVSRGKGLWGEIVGHVGLSSNLKMIEGLDFVKHSETPGLGARITEEWFKEQFRGKKGPLKRVAEGTKSEKSDEFDAITGATITSKAVESMINETMKDAPDIVKKGGK
jgi:Na+-transporting NADH:ubiquinone oxidoreductase subunit C